jgi:hypothetical protein
MEERGKKGHCTYSEKQNVPFCDSPKAMALRLTPPLPRTGPKLPGPSESIVTSTPITDSYVANSPPTTIRVGSTALIAIGVTNCVGDESCIDDCEAVRSPRTCPGGADERVQKLKTRKPRGREKGTFYFSE